MRRSDRQITDLAEIEFILSSASFCHLSMVDDGKPYVVPMNFGYADGVLYLHSAPQGRKIDVLRKNPRVCFSIVHKHELVTGKKACSWSAKYASVVGTGKAEIVSDRDGKEIGLTILMGQYSEEEFDFSKEKLDGMVVIRVEIDTLMGKSSETGKG
jgi:nitroimidazol reductase NimA-like FMN-containing flavoprotein (pyridoxamine 5'-phosphate oxidase superfamily)